jgi:hypothetical protein
MGLVVAARVEREAPQQLAVGGQHLDVQPVDEHDHTLATVSLSDPDVMQPGAVSKA